MIDFKRLEQKWALESYIGMYLGEWDKSGWSIWVLCIVGGSSSLSEELSSAKILSGWGDQILVQIIFALEHLGAYEQWSLWSISLTWDFSLGFIIFLFESIILEHHGAFEQWSLWSTAQLKDCSLGLLQIFSARFCYCQVIYRMIEVYP